MDSVGRFGTYNDGILVVMGVVIVVATVVIIAVVIAVVRVNRNKFYKNVSLFLPLTSLFSNILFFPNIFPHLTQLSIVKRSKALPFKDQKSSCSSIQFL